MGAETVSHNTGAMRDWSGNINTAATEYDSDIRKLYSLVDSFVASDFTGGLSQQFADSVLNQRDKFYALKDTLEEIAKYVNGKADSIDDDDAMLSNEIKNNSIFG